MEALLRALQGYGIGRLAAILGGTAGAAAILIALMLRIGTEPKSLLYANLDLKEASQITAALDQAGVKYEAKGDGSTIMVDRDKVASARLMLSGKGLPTSGSVGYEIFDNAPALGQTDFMQNLDRQRALEGELARTIRAIQGVSFVRVHLVMPKRQLFDDDAAAAPSASILVATSSGRLSSGQVRAIRNLVAGAVPDLKPERVSVADQEGELLAGEGDGDVAGDDGGTSRAQVEEKLRHTIKDLVEGVVGPGKARVQVSADIDTAHVTTQEEKFDPDGQVVRSTQTTDEKSDETKPTASGGVGASQNLPGAAGASSTASDSSNSGKQEETTNYEISKTTKTEVQEPGGIKRLSVAVAVDGVTTGPDGKPQPYRPRSAEEMKQIEQLVRSAMGFDQSRGDQVTVVNVRFDHAGVDEGVAAASPFSFDKNDLMRAAELGVLLVVAGLIVFFVVRPMLSGAGGAVMAALPGAAPVYAAPAGGTALPPPAGGSGAALALPGPQPDAGIDIAKIEGQVRASSVKKVAEFVEKHPEESVSILRTWLHDA